MNSYQVLDMANGARVHGPAILDDCLAFVKAAGWGVDYKIDDMPPELEPSALALGAVALRVLARDPNQVLDTKPALLAAARELEEAEAARVSANLADAQERAERQVRDLDDEGADDGSLARERFSNRDYRDAFHSGQPMHAEDF